MPRKSWIDAASAFHHIIARGMDRGKIIQNSTDKRNFLERLGEILKSTDMRFFAWALIPSHVHSSLKTDNSPVVRVMRRLLTGHAHNTPFSF